MTGTRARLALRVLIALAALAVAAIGLAGAWSYWESYYQHRGFAPVPVLPGSHQGRRERVVFYSPALGREADYYVYLPPGYDPARERYPVFYLLHGSPGRPEVYYGIASMPRRMDNLISQGRMGPMILVLPDGRIGGSTFSDSEWANTPAGNYESYVVDVVHDVDTRFATVADRDNRVIAGFSAGAYGATNITLHHLDLFANLQSWSGYYVQTRTGVFARASRAQLRYNSPLYYVHRIARQLALYPLRAFLFTGRDDDVSPQLAPMAHALAAEGARVTYALYPGGHDWQLWHAHLNQLLVMAWHDVLHPPTPGPGAARFLTPGVTPIPHGRGRRHHRRAHRGTPVLHRRHGAAGRHVRISRQLVWAAPAPLPPSGGRPAHRGRRPLGLLTLLAGLLLALASAALINLGFLLQHRGLRPQAGAGLAATLWAALRNRTWLAGQVVGWVGFGAQIVAVAVAPLSLVQAFAAGGLALSVPLASKLFSHRLGRSQVLAVLVIAAGLAVLPIGFAATADRMHPQSLGVAVGLAVALGVGTSAVRRAAARAVAAGIFYGAADAAIKAVAVGGHGPWSSAPVWGAVAGLTTFAGFLAFQSALQRGSAIEAISLMNALATLVALGCGIGAFGESLGVEPASAIAHAVAILVVLGCLPVLAAAQAELTEAGEPRDGEKPSPPPAVTA